MNKSALKIRNGFDAAAQHYDAAANAQADIASQLVAWADVHKTPQDILDIGSGTGFVAERVVQKWPHATITALDHAPSMLAEAQRKIPRLQTIIGDAAAIDIPRRFDMIFSSMMLHWLPEPQKVLHRWKNWLKPHGRLYVAVLVENSFKEWQDLCHDENFESGLWPMPDTNFVDHVAVRHEIRDLPFDYSSAHEFFRQLKTIGAATSKENHRPVSPAVLRRIFDHAPRPFTITYRTLFAELNGQKNIEN